MSVTAENVVGQGPGVNIEGIWRQIYMTVICFLVSSYFTSIYNCAKLLCRSVTTDINNDNINFDLNGFVISLIKSNFYCLTIGSYLIVFHAIIFL